MRTFSSLQKRKVVTTSGRVLGRCHDLRGERTATGDDRETAGEADDFEGKVRQSVSESVSHDKRIWPFVRLGMR